LGALEPQTPFSGETLVVEVPENESKVKAIINSSRSLYATHYKPEEPKILAKKTKIKSSQEVKSLH
jgi:hypothetical protein